MVLMLICWDFYFLITGELPLDMEKIIGSRQGSNVSFFLVSSYFPTGERKCLLVPCLSSWLCKEETAEPEFIFIIYCILVGLQPSRTSPHQRQHKSSRLSQSPQSHSHTATQRATTPVGCQTFRLSEVWFSGGLFFWLMLVDLISHWEAIWWCNFLQLSVKSFLKLSEAWHYVGCCRIVWLVRGERNGGNWQQKLHRERDKERNEFGSFKRNLPLVNFMSIPIAFGRQKLLLFNGKIFSFYWLGNKEGFLPVTDTSKYIQGTRLGTL